MALKARSEWLVKLRIPFAIYIRATREEMASRFASVTSEEIIYVEAAPENKESDLSGSLSKSGPFDFGTKNKFASFFVSEKGLAHICKKAIYYFPVSYFCFASSQNCILAEFCEVADLWNSLILWSVLRPLKYSWRNFVLTQILRYIHYFEWRNTETFRKILSLPEKLEDTLLWGLCSPTKI